MEKKRVIVVLSSSTPERQYLSTRLESHGYVVAGIPPGFHVLSYVCSARPELIVYDIHDFWNDAMNMIRRIRELSPETRVIALREGANWRVFFAALDAGAVDLLSKPYTSRQLLDAMTLALGEVTA